MQLQESPQSMLGWDEPLHCALQARAPQLRVAPSHTLFPLLQSSSQRPPAQLSVVPEQAWLPSHITWQS